MQERLYGNYHVDYGFTNKKVTPIVVQRLEFRLGFVFLSHCKNCRSSLPYWVVNVAPFSENLTSIHRCFLCLLVEKFQ